MGSGGVAIAALFIVICLEVPFSDGLGGGDRVKLQKIYDIDNKSVAYFLNIPI